LKKGEVVLDLGSGGGFDCFLASAKVGAKGKVIGVDMTAEMLDKSEREHAQGRLQERGIQAGGNRKSAGGR